MERPNSHLVLEYINNIVIPDNQSGIGGVMEYIEDYLIKSDREHMFVIALDDDNLPLNVNMAHVGTLNRSVASTRDVVKPALLSKASKLVVLHNHPSGDILPSNEDKLFTERLSEACDSVGLSLVEHYVVGLEKGKYSRLIQTEETDILLTANHQQPHVDEVPVVNLTLNNAVNATYSKTYGSQEELEPAIRQFIDQQAENKHYAFGFGNKNQLVSIVGASEKVFSSQKGMEMIRQRLILSNANKVVFAHTKPLKNNAEFLEHYTWIKNEKKHFELFDMKVLDAFLFFKDKSLSVLYPNGDKQTEFFNYSQEHAIEQQSIPQETIKKLTKEEMKQLPILEVAQALGMSMIRSGREYYWDEHDSLKINPSKNMFSWYSRDIHGDTIKLVQTIKEIPFAQAIQFLQTGTYTENYTPKTEPKKPFVYSLKRFETAFDNAKRYLVNERRLSPETVDFFVSKGSMVSANYKTKDNPTEEVIVFQYKDHKNKIIGGSMQGITQNKELHPGKGYLKKMMFNSDGAAGFKVDVGTPERLIFFEAPIDLMSYYELHQDKLQNVRLVAMDGLKEVVISRALFELIAFQNDTPHDKLESALSHANEFLDHAASNTTFFEEPGNENVITLAVDNDEAGLKFIEKLQDKGCVFQVELPEKPENLSKMDWNGLLYSEKEKNKQLQMVSEEQHVLSHNNEKGEQPVEKSTQNEDTKKALEDTQEQINDRTSGGTDFLQFNTEGSVIPVSQNDTFERTVTSRPTSSYPLLNFNTTFEKVQNKIGNYHPVTVNDIRRLNQYAASIQSTAKWYLDELADSKINYVYLDNKKESILQVEFKKENFIHLLGLRPFEVGKQAGDFLVDLVQGNGSFNQLLISNSIKDKLQVIPMLSDILDSQSFVLNDLSSVEKLHKLNFSEAIKSKDEDFLLLFKDKGLENVPASLMKLKGNLATSINDVNEKIILGVYRERNGVLEQLSINEEYIKDGGKELLSILENREERLEPIYQDIDRSVSAVEAIDKNKDSDGDGISDYDEIQQGTDPNNPRSNSKEKSQDNNDVPISELIANNDRVGLMTHLKEGMRQFAHSEQYKTYLTAMSKFYHYSPRNLQLLLAQNPYVQQVASYQSWQKDFERHVVKEAKALKVFVPLLVKQKDDNGNFIVDENGEIQTRTIFKLGNVFDVSQTEGKALPQPIYRLESSVEGYKELYQAIKHINAQNGVSIHFDTLPKDVNGLYQPLENRIVISNRGMSESQIIKTLIHETAHAQLHQTGNVNQLSDEYAIQELRAESIAYVVANHYGIDTSEYSFGYLHVWSGDKVYYSDLEKSLTTIQQTSKQFIEKIDTTLEKIKSNTLQKNQFNVNLEKAKQAEAQTILNKSVGGDVTKKMITPTAEKS